MLFFGTQGTAAAGQVPRRRTAGRFVGRPSVSRFPFLRPHAGPAGTVNTAGTEWRAAPAAPLVLPRGLRNAGSGGNSCFAVRVNRRRGLSGSGICGPGPTARRPTSASTGPCSRNGPTPGPTPQRPSVLPLPGLAAPLQSQPRPAPPLKGLPPRQPRHQRPWLMPLFVRIRGFRNALRIAADVGGCCSWTGHRRRGGP